MKRFVWVLLLVVSIPTSALASFPGRLIPGKPEVIDANVASVMRGATIAVEVGTPVDFGVGAWSSTKPEIDQISAAYGLTVKREVAIPPGSRCDWSIPHDQLEDPARAIADRIQHDLAAAYGMVPVAASGQGAALPTPAAATPSGRYAVSVKTIGWQACSFTMFTDLALAYIATVAVVDQTNGKQIVQATCSFGNRHAATEKPLLLNYFSNDMAALKKDLASVVDLCSSAFSAQSLRIPGTAAGQL